MSGDYIKFGSIILNGEGAVGQTGAIYTVTRAAGLGGLPRPRVIVTQLVGVGGAVLSEADDDMRVIALEGEVHAPSHELLMDELERFKYEISTQRGEQWLYWTPEGQTARKIEAVLQNDGAVALDTEDDTTATFRLELLCADPYWWSISSTTASKAVTATGQTLSVTNDGTAYSEPVIRITPTSAKASGYSYKRWVAIYNRIARALTNYPTQITSQGGISGLDHQTLVGAGKSQADGDDLRVEVDGVQVDRWLDGVNTDTCKIWVNLTFQPEQHVELVETFEHDADISSISVFSVADIPAPGIVYAVSTGEAFTYTGKDSALNRLTGVTRAAKGTTAAKNWSGQQLYWVEHDVWLLYGNASVTAPVTDDTVKPVFELDHSTNISWVYETFRVDGEDRPGQWFTEAVMESPVFYGSDHGGAATTYTELGIALITEVSWNEIKGRFKTYNPCGITNANFTNGEKYCSNILYASWVAQIESSLNGSTWTLEYSIPLPAEGVWEAWSRDEGLTTGSLYAAISLSSNHYMPHYLEAADCTLTINSSNTPAIVLGDEQGSYSSDIVITMVEDAVDGAAIRLQCTLDLNETLEIDCGERTVTYLADNSNQFQALTLQSPSLRNYWFRLPGHWDGGKTVTFRYNETGVAGVTLTIIYYDRWL